MNEVSAGLFPSPPGDEGIKNAAPRSRPCSMSMAYRVVIGPDALLSGYAKMARTGPWAERPPSSEMCYVWTSGKITPGWRLWPLHLGVSNKAMGAGRGQIGDTD